MIAPQTFHCPHCGAPGQVAYGQAEYSCLCRMGVYTRAEPKPAPKCICKPAVIGPNSVSVPSADPMCPIHGGFMQNAVPQRGPDHD